MYCPGCGAQQSHGKRFCTHCGTNLHLVSQALSGQFPPAGPPPANVYLPDPTELERRKELTTGIRMTVIAGGFLVIKLLGFLFSSPFRGGGFSLGFFGWVALLVFGVGLSKLLSARPALHAGAPFQPPVPPPAPTAHQIKPPQPVFSSVVDVPSTGEINPAPARSAMPVSVTEDDTRRL